MGDVPAEIEELLADEPVSAHLATCREGRPHAAAVWYRYADGTVEVVTTGRKLANVRANPRVALSIEKGERGLPEWTVTLRGTATVVDDADASRAAARRINQKYGVDPDAWVEENTLMRIDVGSASHTVY